PATLDCGNQPVGSTSDARGVTLTNSGLAPLHLGTVAVTGTNSADFAIVSDSGETTLAPGASRTITLRFSPTNDWKRDAILSLPSDTAPMQGTSQVDLSGLGTRPWISLDAGSIGFGHQVVGTSGSDSAL